MTLLVHQRKSSRTVWRWRFVFGAMMALCQHSAASAADFVSMCEANQVYDTGKATGDDDRRVCRCIHDRMDARGEGVAIEVFRKVLQARRAGQGLHPSQLDLDELVALMSFSDGVKSCGEQVKTGKAAF